MRRQRSLDVPITKREAEVLGHLGLGLTSRDIAALLSVSVHTVQKHRSNLMEKLGVHTAAELASVALRRGLAVPKDR